MVSPEKALCDKIVLTPRVNPRSIKQTQQFLFHGLRMDSEILNPYHLKTSRKLLSDLLKMMMF